MIRIKINKERPSECYIAKSELAEDSIRDLIDKSLIEDDEKRYTFSYALYPLIISKLCEAFQEIDAKDVVKFYNQKAKNFDVSKQQFLRDDQYEMVKEVISKEYRGIIQVSTGSGKGEIIVFLAANCTLPGNRLVLTNNNQVATELELRFKKYGYDLDKLRTKVLNPISFMNSNRKNDPEMQKFLEGVTLIQIDELESVTTSLEELLKLIPNYKILYGYSASPEKVKGLDLSNPKVIFKANEDAVKVMKLAGFSLCYSAPIKPLQINIVVGKLPNEWFPPFIEKMKGNEQAVLVMKQKYSQANLFKFGGVIFKALDKYVLPNKQKILFIPYRFIEHGDLLFKHYELSKYKIVQWDGEKIRSNFSKKKDLTQADIKQLSEENAFDILIASSVANRGVDFRNMEDIFLYIHSQYANVIQTIGRCSRESAGQKANVWLLHNSKDNTPFYSMLCQARLKRIELAYKEAGIHKTTYYL